MIVFRNTHQLEWAHCTDESRFLSWFFFSVHSRDVLPFWRKFKKKIFFSRSGHLFRLAQARLISSSLECTCALVESIFSSGCVCVCVCLSAACSERPLLQQRACCSHTLRARGAQSHGALSHTRSPWSGHATPLSTHRERMVTSQE